MVRRLLQDNKFPATSTGSRAAAAPGPGLLQDSWERARLIAPSPAKQGLSSTERDLVAWSHREGNKDEVANTQGRWAPTETVDASWGELRAGPVMGPDLDILWSSWRCGPCEMTGPSLYGAAGFSRRNFSKRKSEKRDTQGLFGEFSCNSCSSLLPTQPHGAPTVAWKAPRSHWGTRESESPNLWHQRLLGNWAGG